MKSIIIAEDNKPVRKTYARFIKRISNAEVYEVEDGKELVEMVKQKNYDLIFTDNDMPYTSGLTAIAEIRTFNCSIPICMISGDNIERTMPEAIRVGATDYIDKGSNDFTRDLETVILKYIQK